MSANATCSDYEVTEEKLARQIAEIGQLDVVVKVHASQHGNRVSVWTVVEDFTRQKRDMIYELEGRLMDAYPENQFDFSVVQLSDYSAGLEAPVAYERSR